MSNAVSTILLDVGYAIEMRKITTVSQTHKKSKEKKIIYYVYV